MRHIADNLIFLNAKQAEEFLGNNEPGDIEFFDGIPARAYWSKTHDGMFIVLFENDEQVTIVGFN